MNTCDNCENTTEQDQNISSQPFCDQCGDDSRCDGFMDMQCVIYHWNTSKPSKLTCLGFDNGANLEEIIEKIDTLVCNNLNVPLVAEDTTTIDFTTWGPSDHHIKAVVKISEDAPNGIEVRPDGLFVNSDLFGNGGNCCNLQDVTDIDQVDDVSVTTNPIQTAGVGINTPPTGEFPFIVDVLDGEISFDGIRLELGTDKADVDNSNLFIGHNTGNLNLGNFCTGVGEKVMVRATGIGNTAFGRGAGVSVQSDDNTFVGTFAGRDTDDGENVFIGSGTGNHTYSDKTICIGNNASGGDIAYVDTIPTSNINIGTAELKGSAIAAFISAAGLSIGDKKAFSIEFTGVNFPPPLEDAFTSRKGYVTASDTIELQDTGNFTSISGVNTPFTLTQYFPITNAISIGYGANAKADNEITIGNEDNDLLTINEVIVDIATPAVLHKFLVWDGAKYTPGTINSGTLATNGNGVLTSFTVTHGFGSSPSNIQITPIKADSVGGYVSAKNSTTFTITFATAPPSGTNNVNFYWQTI